MGGWGACHPSLAHCHRNAAASPCRATIKLQMHLYAFMCNIKCPKCLRRANAPVSLRLCDWITDARAYEGMFIVWSNAYLRRADNTHTWFRLIASSSTFFPRRPSLVLTPPPPLPAPPPACHTPGRPSVPSPAGGAVSITARRIWRPNLWVGG